MAIDLKTGRPYGDHGTADDAIQFVLENRVRPGKETVFLWAWDQGRAWDEFPEFYRFLEQQEAPEASGSLAAAAWVALVAALIIAAVAFARWPL